MSNQIIIIKREFIAARNTHRLNVLREESEQLKGAENNHKIISVVKSDLGTREKFVIAHRLTYQKTCCIKMI